VDSWAEQIPDAMDTGSRGELLDRVLAVIQTVTVTHPLRVAVDGPPAAGKTTLADDLGDALRAQGRYVIRASIESFLLPRAQRYRRAEVEVFSGRFTTSRRTALCPSRLKPHRSMQY
jgi:uridine kinase